MAAKANVKKLVADVIAGSDLQSAWKQLGKTGRKGVDVILDALEGKCDPAPRSRHPRDVFDDLLCALGAIGKLNPEHLLSALERRPQHTLALIWELGCLGQSAHIDTLVAYARHKDHWVRWAAVFGLSKLRKESLQKTFLAALRDRADLVR